MTMLFSFDLTESIARRSMSTTRRFCKFLRRTDKASILMIIKIILRLFLHKNLGCGCSLDEAILMSTHNIGFYEEMAKIIFPLSSRMHLIYSSISCLVFSFLICLAFW